MEIARTYLITGVPWDLLGYAVSPNGLRQLASVTAVYGLSFLAVATSALLAGIFLAPRQKRLSLALVLWSLALTAANLILGPPPPRPATSSALLVQPNVPLEDAELGSWAPWRNSTPLAHLVAITLSNLRTLSESSSATPLVVWAENPAPFYFSRDPNFR